MPLTRFTQHIFWLTLFLKFSEYSKYIYFQFTIFIKNPSACNRNCKIYLLRKQIAPVTHIVAKINPTVPLAIPERINKNVKQGTILFHLTLP